MDETAYTVLHKNRQSILSIPARYVLAIMVHLGLAVIYSLRVNLNVAILNMINTTVNHSQIVEGQAPTFPWTHDEKESLLSLFFYGYLSGQVVGGMLSTLYGARIVLGISVLLTSVLTVATPMAASLGLAAIGTVRVLLGVVQAVSFPSIYLMLGVWTLAKDRTVVSSLACAGNYLGTAITLPLSGIICSASFPWGWPAVFYLTGITGFIWSFFWLLIVHDSPCSHPRISEQELELFRRQHDREHHHHSPSLSEIPWSSILLSGPVVASVLAIFCANWSFYTILTNLPTYFQDVYHFSIAKNGLLSALPYVFAGVVQVVSALCSDLILRRCTISRTLLRKIFTLIGFLGGAVSLVATGYISTDHSWFTVLLFVMALSFHVLHMSGFSVAIVEISPNFSGMIMGFANTFGSIPGCVAPLAIAEFTKTQSTQTEWRKVFYLSAALNVFGALVYSVLGSSKEQVWNAVDNGTQSRRPSTVADKYE